MHTTMRAWTGVREQIENSHLEFEAMFCYKVSSNDESCTCEVAVMDEQEARQLIMRWTNQEPREHGLDYVIASMTLSDCGHFWIASGNTRGWILWKLSEYAAAGGGAILLNVYTREITSLGSIQSPQQFIQHYHEQRELRGRHLVLNYADDPTNLRAILRFKQYFKCTPGEAKQVLLQQQSWCTGCRSSLEEIQQELEQHGVLTRIDAVDTPDALIELEPWLWSFNDLIYALFPQRNPRNSR